MFDAHYDVVWRTLRRVGVPAGDADDAAQEVFIVAARRLADIEDGRERAFLLGTAVRIASDFRRRATRRPTNEAPPEDLPDPAADPETLADRAKARALLDRLLEEMPDDFRTVFVLYEIEALTMAAIAAALNLPAGTVASRLRRARELYQRAIERLQAKERRIGA